MDEIRLIEQAAAGNKEAFCELYDMYRDRLYRYAYYRLRDPHAAEDAVSECVITGWQSLGSLRRAEAFSVWLFRILSACCARQIRVLVSDREKQEVLQREERPPASDPSLTVELTEALDQLSEEEREFVLLSVVAGMTSREIGEIRGMAAGTVRSKVSRSLAKMRKYLEMGQ